MKAKSRALLLSVLALCAFFGYVPNSVGQGGGVQTLAYVPPAGRVGGLDGFVRVVNRSTTPATVEITGFDDTGARYGPVTLAMPASSSVRLLSEHLERGSAVDGLPVGLGNGTGDWRLEFRSASHVEAVALVRTPDKFMTSLQAVVEPEAAGATVYPVAVFNPGSNTAKASVLRLVNPGNAAAAVTITGIDDRGASGPGGNVRLTVPAGGAVRVTAAELEAGRSGLQGRLGDGAGKWRLRVSSDRPLLVMNLLRSVTSSGLVYVSNLSVGLERAGGEAPPHPPADDHGDTEATATLVQAPSTTTGVLGAGGDLDYFRFVLSQPGSLQVRTTGDLDTVGTLSRGGSVIATNDDGAGDDDGLNFRITVPNAQAGTWYVEVKGYDAETTGAYTLQVAFTATPPPAEYVGAIAAGWQGSACSDGYGWAWALNRPDQASARSEAEAACRNAGYRNCAWRVTFDRCGALVYGETVSTCAMLGGYGDTRAAAEAHALASCRDAGYDCRIAVESASGRNASYCNANVQDARQAAAADGAGAASGSPRTGSRRVPSRIANPVGEGQ